MERKTGNFQEGIHEKNYLDAYGAKLIRASGIADWFRPKESLNGEWRYAVDQYDTCLRNKWYNGQTYDAQGRPYPVDFSFDTWETIPVPSCWNTRSEKLFLYEGPVVYTRTFAYENRGEKRVFLKFGGVNYQAAVFVNKTYMGMHKGGSTPFYIEITDVLQRENRVMVVADNTRRRQNVPCENTDWFNYGGVYREVELLRLPAAFIREIFVGLEPGSGYGRVSARLKIDGAQNGQAVLRIPELGIETKIDVQNGRGETSMDVTPELWSPENPKLYDVFAEFGDDTLRERIGFREISARGEEILLNGKSVFLNGVCAHEESAAHGKSVTEDEIRENYALAREMNCNFMRLAHYPHAEAAARIADEAGILLWEEIPVYWAIEFDNAATYDDAKNQLAELIVRDQNRASVIIWSVGNENADTDSRLRFMGELVKSARALDGTRLISAACLVNHETLVIEDRLAEFLDVIGINEYYGWYEPDFTKLPRIFENSRPGKPVVITEFGADARAGRHGTRDDMFSEEYQLDVYERQIETLARIPCVRGTAPWILFDFRCPRRTHVLQNYYNLKGLLSADKRHKKLAFEAMRQFYAGR